MPLTDYIFDRKLLASCTWTGNSRTPGERKFGFGNCVHVHQMILMLARLYQPNYSECDLIVYLKKILQYGKRRLNAMERSKSTSKRSRLSQPKNRPLLSKSKKKRDEEPTKAPNTLDEDGDDHVHDVSEDSSGNERDGAETITEEGGAIPFSVDDEHKTIGVITEKTVADVITSESDIENGKETMNNTTELLPSDPPQSPYHMYASPIFTAHGEKPLELKIVRPIAGATNQMHQLNTDAAVTVDASSMLLNSKKEAQIIDGGNTKNDSGDSSTEDRSGSDENIGSSAEEEMVSKYRHFECYYTTSLNQNISYTYLQLHL